MAAHVVIAMAAAAAVGGICEADELESREVSFVSSKYRLVGTLTSPAHRRAAIASVLIIGGSGPVDRDGALPTGASPRELRGHDHRAILVGEREASTEFTTIVIDWLKREGRVNP